MEVLAWSPEFSKDHPSHGGFRFVMGVPPVIIHLNRIFHEKPSMCMHFNRNFNDINHPAIGVPPSYGNLHIYLVNPHYPQYNPIYNSYIWWLIPFCNPWKISIFHAKNIGFSEELWLWWGARKPFPDLRCKSARDREVRTSPKKP